jgi:PncC family amidohydrolase
MELLQVPEKTLQQYGAVSEQTAAAMARGIRKNAKVDIGLSTTGIAGPTGGSKDKPVGLVYIGLATSKTVTVKKFQFTEDRLTNKEYATDAALSLLLGALTHW